MLWFSQCRMINHMCKNYCSIQLFFVYARNSLHDSRTTCPAILKKILIIMLINIKMYANCLLKPSMYIICNPIYMMIRLSSIRSERLFNHSHLYGKLFCLWVKKVGQVETVLIAEDLRILNLLAQCLLRLVPI